MTFEYSRTIKTSASPAAVWALWGDPGTWPEWDPAVVSVAFVGYFFQGASGTMVLTGVLEVPVTLEIVEAGRRYLDQLTMGDLVIRIDHVVEGLEDGAEVTVSTLITGPGAEDIGPMVTADAPRAMDALANMAENGS